MVDLAIIGGGPAGLSAAVYAKRAGLSTILFEKMFFGGQMVNSHNIENYPGYASISGIDLTAKFTEAVEDVEKRMEEITAVDFSNKILFTARERIQARSILIATGAKPRLLGVEGEERLSGMGVSYCATCDGAFFRNRTVCVVGGGNTALDDALYLSKFAKEIYLIHRREAFRADELTVNKVKAEPLIHLVLDTEVQRLDGKDSLENVLVRNKKTGEEHAIQADGIFIAVGNIPQTEFLNGKVELTSEGYIKTDESLQTSIKGVFAAGDVREKELRQIVTAAGDGAVAVDSIRKHLQSA